MFSDSRQFHYVRKYATGAAATASAAVTTAAVAGTTTAAAASSAAAISTRWRRFALALVHLGRGIGSGNTAIGRLTTRPPRRLPPSAVPSSLGVADVHEDAGGPKRHLWFFVHSRNSPRATLAATAGEGAARGRPRQRVEGRQR